MTFTNPILPGFYPDPSICRVGDNYYMATSSFCWWPGIPIFHSRDLVHWRQLGHAIHRPGQIDYSRSAHSEGLWAPTLRYHEGTFYLINTLVSEGREGRRQNYIVTAKDPAGPWSDPVEILGADGIDPSLYFEEDGSLWYTGNYIATDGPDEWRHGIYLCRLDPATFQFAEERIILWKGADTKSKWLEAPHILKKDGWYYLITAEGGTFTNHCVMMARSRDLKGPYQPCPRNPVITHRHLSLEHPIAVTGHADFLETQTGEWWTVLLAVRPRKGGHFNLGRETFLAPLVWEEDGWPRLDTENGLVNPEERLPALPPHRFASPMAGDHFDDPTLGFAWNLTRSLDVDFYSLTQRPGWLRLALRPAALTDPYATPALVARRQQHKRFLAGTCMEFTPGAPGEEAGLALVQSDAFHYRFTLALRGGKAMLQVHCCVNNAPLVNHACDGRELEERVLASVAAPAGGKLYLFVESDGESYSFHYGRTESERVPVLEGADGTVLSTNRAGGFVGAYIGMYASANGAQTAASADFDWFSYEPLDH